MREGPQLRDNHSLIEYLLTGVDLLEPGGAEASSQGPSQTRPPLLNEQDRENAKQIRHFIDQMPGGFFIYRDRKSVV